MAEKTEKKEKATPAKRSVAKTKKETASKETAATKETIKEVIKEEAKKIYTSKDTIPCLSITNGELIFTSKKSGSEYYWGGLGDICDITYEDLLYLKAKRSKLLFAPYFVMLEEVFPENEKLHIIKECYDKISDIDDFLDNEQAVREFVLDNTVPVGLKRMVAEEVSKRVREGSFINLNIINILDKALGLDLKMYVM